MFKVINGNGRGSNLSEIESIEVQKPRLGNADVFLDQTTGDIYRFNYDMQEWAAKANIGMHNKKAVNRFDSIGKYVLHTPIYRPKAVERINLTKARKSESIVYVRKVYLQHWAMSEIDYEFIAPNEANWEVHPFNFKAPDRTFTILAESDESPQILLFSNNNILATQFEMNHRYPNTIVPLTNFIKTKLVEVKALSVDKTLSIFQIDSSWYETNNIGLVDNGRKVMDHSGVTFTVNNSDDFKHSGYSTKLKGFQYVENNAIQKGTRSFKKKRRNNVMFGTSVKKFGKNRNSKKKDDRKMKRKQTLYGELLGIHDLGKLKFGNEDLDESDLERSNSPRLVFHSSKNFLTKYNKELKLEKPEGFDFRDGWVPGYKSLIRTKRSNPVVRRAAKPRFYNRFKKDFAHIDHEEVLRKVFLG